MTDLAQNLALQQNKLRNWLFDHALPFWWNTGGDLKKGGFYEKINLDGTPHDINRRTRVAARQVFSYALADRMGYEGATKPAIDQGLNWLTGPARNNETGMLYAVLQPDGTVVRADFDFYDHAFALLAYASAFRNRPDDKQLETTAVAIRDKIMKDYAHPVRGFEESIPRTLPLKANPHMHMFEACLAWLEAGGDQTWHTIAAMIADLCVDKFIDPKNGSLREFFDGDWNPITGDMGRIIEPGHQFEWAWLFLRWANITGIDSYRKTAQTLIEIAETAGTDPVRDVTFNELWDDFTPKDQNARLWPQTERMKAFTAVAHAAETSNEKEAAISKAIQASVGLEKYLNAPIEGMYRDRLKPNGDFEIEPAPASSLYHIICAIDEVCSLKV
ncbi:MAG: AGE family epimerase/isomerase [Asticcacaulis sp.]